MKLTGIYLSGRLGNHLFQYAYVYALAKQKGGWFFLDQLRFNFALPKYFKIPTYHRQLNSLLTKLYQFAGGLFTTVNEPNIENNNKAWCYNFGYFQDERFFENCLADIKREFTLTQPIQSAFNAKYGSLFANNKTIAVHVRKTDIVTLGIDKGAPVADASLQPQHYFNCFNAISDIDTYKIIFATDDVSYVKTHFGHLPNVIIDTNDEITDLQILMNANKVITANSSFSWWGAYLNSKKDAVFYPAEWNIVPYIAPPNSQKGLWHKI